MDKQIFWPILLAALAQLAPCLNGLDGPGRHKSQIGHSQDEKRELKFNRIQAKLYTYPQLQILKKIPVQLILLVCI